jgi:hypothetical protein
VRPLETGLGGWKLRMPSSLVLACLPDTRQPFSSPLRIPCLPPTKPQWVVWGSGSFVAPRQYQFAWNGF